MPSTRPGQETVLSAASPQPSQNRTLFPTQLTSQIRPPPSASRGEEQHPLFRQSLRLAKQRNEALGSREKEGDKSRLIPLFFPPDVMRILLVGFSLASPPRGEAVFPGHLA